MATMYPSTRKRIVLEKRQEALKKELKMYKEKMSITYKMINNAQIMMVGIMDDIKRLRDEYLENERKINRLYENKGE